MLCVNTLSAAKVLKLLLLPREVTQEQSSSRSSERIETVEADAS